MPSEQPREGTRVECERVCFGSYCPCAQPEQPRGEGDDLAKLRQELLLRAADLNADYVRSGAESAARDCRLMQRAAFLLHASTHPEQSERIVGAALDLLDSLGAPHYHDLIGMTYTLRKEQADNLRAALNPASPTPTAARAYRSARATSTKEDG